MFRYRIRKALNGLLNKAEFIMRRERLLSYPPIIFIEPTNRCSLSCPLCPTGRRDPRYPGGAMSLEIFSRLMDEIGPWARTVHLYNWGEPLLHDRIWDMVRVARRYGLKVWLSTTLNRLPADGPAEMISSGLDRLNVSIDGLGQGSYGKYRKGGDFETVMANLKAVLSEKKHRRSRRPVVRWQYLVMRHNEADIERARETARMLGVAFEAKPVRLDMADFSRPAADGGNGGHDWLPENELYNRYIAEPRSDYPHGHPCRYLWDRAAIGWDGNVAPCCRIYGERDYFGSAIDGGFRRIWNGPSYRESRGLFTGNGNGGKTVCALCVESEEHYS